MNCKCEMCGRISSDIFHDGWTDEELCDVCMRW